MDCPDGRHSLCILSSEQQVLIPCLIHNLLPIFKAFFYVSLLLLRMSDLLLWFQMCHSHKPIMMLAEFTTEMVLKWVFGIK